MDDLDFHAKDLLQAARAQEDPSREDAMRLERKFVAVIGAATFTSALTAAAPAAAVVGTGGIAKFGFAVAILAGVGATTVGGVYAVRHRSAPAQEAPAELIAHQAETPPVQAPEPHAPSPALVEEEEAAPALDPPARLPQAKASGRAPTASLNLDDELAIIGKAQAAINTHKPSQAMGYLDEHAARFPNGQLKSEREAMRIMARCESGNAQAKAAAKRIVSRQPNSGLSRRLASICGL